MKDNIIINNEARKIQWKFINLTIDTFILFFLASMSFPGYWISQPISYCGTIRRIYVTFYPIA